MAQFNNGKFNRRNLEINKHGCRIAFRYGGLARNFDKTNKEWFAGYSTDDIGNPFIKCACCDKAFNPDEHPYTGVFHVAPRTVKYRNKFAIICKKCAYKISDIVIEADSTEIQTNKKGGKTKC